MLFGSAWARGRTLFVPGIVTTALLACATFLHLDEFHLGEGSTFARIAAWIWVIAYAQVPLTLANAFRIQERAGGRKEYAVHEPLESWFRAVLVLHAVLLVPLGLGLVAAPGTFDGAWPWPLPPLAAGAVGAWVAGIGAGLGWMAYDGDWRRVRLGAGLYVLILSLELVVVARFWNELAKVGDSPSTSPPWAFPCSSSSSRPGGTNVAVSRRRLGPATIWTARGGGASGRADGRTTAGKRAAVGAAGAPVVTIE